MVGVVPRAEEAPVTRAHLWEASFIVFVASACSLIIELVAGRILAPYIGVSLYTWTSVIGVVLAGASLGNYLGGRLADRLASRTSLGLLFFVCGLASLSILPATSSVVEVSLPTWLPAVALIVVYVGASFFVPSCFLGMVSPMMVKLTLRDLDRAGNVVGRIYAFSAMGSIFGTFLTGFLLVSLLGTRTVIWLVAAVLLAMGLWAGRLWRPRWHLGVVAVVFAAYGLFFYLKASEYQAPCLVESNYYCIKVRASRLSAGPGDTPPVSLVLDHLIHSYVDPDDPTYLGYGYERVYAEVTEYLSWRWGRQQLSSLFIGGGGYAFPRYVNAIYPGSVIDVIEIDPAVTEMVHYRLGLGRSEAIRTFNEDARMFFLRPIEQKYDLIFGDAFNDLSVPYHLTTREFNDRVRSRLSDDGVYLMNVVDNFQTGEFLRAMVRTLQLTFPHIYVVEMANYAEEDMIATHVIVASSRPLDMDEFTRYTHQRAQAEAKSQPSIASVLTEPQYASSGSGSKSVDSVPLSPERLEAFLNKGRGIVLTDDYAPVDNLVAPLIIERGF